MSTTRKIISLSTDSEDTTSSTPKQPGECLANQYKILYVQKTFITSYFCEDVNSSGGSVLVYIIPERIALNKEKLAKVELLVSQLAALESHNVFINYQLLTLSDKEVFIVASIPNGENIKQWCDEHDIASAEERETLKQLLSDAASGMDCLHSHGMLHGEVIPENMLITNDKTLILLNAGLASILKEEDEIVPNTPDDYLNYQAPELWNNAKENAKSEQYALAAIAYELISGKKPYDWVTRPDLFKRVLSTQLPDPPAGATKKESKAIMRALNHDPAKRFSSCRRFVKSLIPFKPTTLQIKTSIAVMLVIFLAIVGAFCVKMVRQEQERVHIAHIEEVEKQERQRQEAELAKKSNEAGQLQWKANEVLNEVLSRHFDEGQTFGVHIKAAQMKYSEGEKAIDAGERAQAFSLFSESLENSQWIRDNAELRNALGQIKQRILAMHDDIEVDCQRLFPEKWADASHKCKEAMSAYEAGNFKEAELLFKETETAFMSLSEEVTSFMKKQYIESAKKALQEENWSLLQEYASKIKALDSALGAQYHELASEGIKKARIASEYALAQNSKEETDWQDVIAHCNTILELDENNDEAKKLRQEAVLATTCNLQANTRIADVVVACSIEMNHETVSGNTNELIRNLPYHTSTTLRFVCIKDNVQYEWNGTLYCNWKGVRTIEYPLEQSSLLLLREAEKALYNKKWDELLNLVNQVLRLDPQSERALQLKETAELEQSCNVEFNTVVNGTFVKAEYSLDSQKYYTDNLHRNLNPGQQYAIEFRAVQAGTQFEGQCSFKADWLGVRKITVTMNKTIDVLLHKAKEALKKKEWNQAYDNAQKVLAILPGNKEATSILETTELQLTSNLKLKATLNGKEVNAFIDSSKSKESTSSIQRNLETGMEYHYALSFKSEEGKVYKGKYTIRCDWIGLKEVEVILENECDKLAQLAGMLIIEEKWEELLLISQKMLVMENDNEQAKHFFELAESKIYKSIQIHATINSKQVIGTVFQMVPNITDNLQKIGKTSTVLKRITANYPTFYIEYANDAVYYWGEIEINENWKGLKIVKIELKRLNPTSISLKKGSIRMTQTSSFHWRGDNEISKALFKDITGQNDYFDYSYSISTVDTGWTFAGEPFIRTVKTKNKNVNNAAALLFCQLLTEKCIRENIIPPKFQFALYENSISPTGFKIELLPKCKID